MKKVHANTQIQFSDPWSLLGSEAKKRTSILQTDANTKSSRARNSCSKYLRVIQERKQQSNESNNDPKTST